MEGIGPGTTLGGRYVVGTRHSQSQGAERWGASDAQTRAPVEILALPTADPRSAALLDAARMARTLRVPGLVAILDLGADGAVSWVAEAPVTTARSLAALIDAGGLPAEEVRRIVGEAATALDAAASRGMHHTQLGPEDVFRTPEGLVEVRGVATAHVLAGGNDDSGAAARADAVALGALAYAGLTGFWPLLRPCALSPAPRLGAGVAAPSEIAAGVSRDLDALCVAMLTNDSGPRTPGEVAQAIGPWSSRPQVGSPTERFGLSRVVGRRSSPSVPKEAAADTLFLPLPAPAATARPPRAGPSPAQRTTRRAEPRPAPSTAGRSAPRPPARSAPRPPRAVPLEPPLPGLPAQPLNRSESRLALLIVVTLVFASLLAGLYGVSKIGSRTALDLSGGATHSSASPKPTGTGASPSSSGLQPLAILSADGFDPLGDNAENSQAAPKVFDGNPATQWVSEGYATAELGGLKSGVGVIVDLGPNVRAKQVTLTLGAAANLELYAASTRSLDGAVKFGATTDAKGTVTIPVPAAATGKQYLIVWFTSLTQAGDGYYRAVLGEISVMG